MSSEQVIAELREAQRGYEASGETEMADQFRDWADRLSTPAAGGDASRMMERLRHCATTMINDDLSEPMTEKRTRMIARIETINDAHDLIEQLQARNAEHRDVAIKAAMNSQDMVQRLSALLDGIEKLEAIFRKHNESLSADALKALREKALLEEIPPK